ncbi:MAG: peptidoglycan-binding protein [Ilumatobacter sp.]
MPMKRLLTSLLATALLGACSTSAGETQIPGGVPLQEPGVAGDAGDVAATVEPTSTVATTTTTTTAAPTTTVAPTTVAPTTAAPTTAPPTTVAPTTVVVTTVPVTTAAPPTTVVQLASCVGGELSFFTEGRRGEIALYQQTLKNLGYDPGEVDGFFGQNTYAAASQEILDNGDVNGPNGTFNELFPDDGAVLPAAFVRLGISC